MNKSQLQKIEYLLENLDDDELVFDICNQHITGGIILSQSIPPAIHIERAQKQRWRFLFPRVNFTVWQFSRITLALSAAQSIAMIHLPGFAHLALDVSFIANAILVASAAYILVTKREINNSIAVLTAGFLFLSMGIIYPIYMLEPRLTLATAILVIFASGFAISTSITGAFYAFTVSLAPAKHAL
jgi:hypothetical protein